MAKEKAAPVVIGLDALVSLVAMMRSHGKLAHMTDEQIVRTWAEQREDSAALRAEWEAAKAEAGS